MGSLSSRPSVPTITQPQIVYVPTADTTSASNASAVTSSSVSTATDTASDTAAEEQSASEAREESLLARDRGSFGTVQTSFRGLLSLASNNADRKTLLGE